MPLAQWLVVLLLGPALRASCATTDLPWQRGASGVGTCASGDGACAASLSSATTGTVLLQATGHTGRTRLATAARAASGPGSEAGIGGEAGASLVGHWSFDGPGAENPEAESREAEWSKKFGDSSGNSGDMALWRYSHQHPYARALPAEGLDGSGGIGFGGRSSARAEVLVFRTLAFWARRDVGCCERIINWARAWRADGVEVARLWVHYGRLFVSVTDATGRATAVVATSKSGTQYPPATAVGWMHLAVVIGEDSLKLYVDGEVVASAPADLTDLGVGAQLTLQLGTGGPHHQFEGVVDEVLLYSDPLTDEGVQALKAQRRCTDAKPFWHAPTQDCSSEPLEGASGEEAAVQYAGPSSLTAHWRFDDLIGTRHWRDDSPLGNALVSRRSSFQHKFAEAIPGTGLGGSPGIRFWSRSSATADVPTFQSLSFWAKRDIGCCHRISTWVAATAGNQVVFRLWVHYEELRATVTDESGSMVVQASSPFPVASESVWEHVAVVVSTDKVHLYLNGEEKNSVDHHMALSNGTVRFQLGNGGPHHPFLGVADELRLYALPLKPEDVASLAAAEQHYGTMAGENLPPRADAGSTLTLWKPLRPTGLDGECVDQDGGPLGVTASWEVISGPDISALMLANASSPATIVSFASGTPVGEYTLQLNCSDGGLSRTARTKLVVFAAHESRAGGTVRSLGQPRWGFPDAGAAVAPVGLWLFDGVAASAAPGSADAALKMVKGSGLELSFTGAGEGRFGGALRLRCDDGACGQLDLGNAEQRSSPWPAMSVSFWFKTNSSNKLNFAAKGSFLMPWMTSPDAGEAAPAWHHYVVARDRNIQKIYLDGQLTSMTSGATDRTEDDAADNLTFGIRAGHPSYGFDGLLDELAVFDFVLSNEEVEVLALHGAEAFTVRGTMNPLWRSGYNTTMLKFFPDLPETPDYTGLVGGLATPSAPPAAYVHPRIFFTPEQLPEVRARLHSTTAGRVAMENVRGLLREQWPTDLASRNATLEELSADYGLAQLLIFQAFRCLVDGDREMASRLGAQLDSLADEMLTKLQSELGQRQQDPWSTEFTSFDATGTWQHIGQPILLRGTTVAFCYDLLYPYLLAGTRDKLRAVIAMATQSTWSIGMDAVEAYWALTSNWLPWVTGDLILTLLAIEGEDGFDEGVYARAAQAYRGWATLGISAVSGSTYEGGGKNSVSGPKFLALALHGYPQYIGMPGIRKFCTQFLLHTMLPNGNFIVDDLWGSVEAKPPLADIVALKFAFPDDEKVDWVYRNSVVGGGYAGVFMDYGGGDGMMPYHQWAVDRATPYTYNNHLTAMVYATDWKGPADWAQHGLSATSGEPLTYMAEDGGLLTTRSAWADRDAAWLWFNVRSLPGGHAAPGRGEFCFYALGEVWAHYPTGHNTESSRPHSVVLIDGEGQAQGVPGKFVHFQDAAQATFGTMDARHAYGIGHFGGSWGGETVNSYMVKPGPYEWQELAWADLPAWYIGANPELDRNRKLGREPPGGFPKAFRTVGLVRSPAQPYALIFDDFQKDDGEREYSWRMKLLPEYYNFDPANGLHAKRMVNRSYFKPEGNDFVLRQSRGGSARLLVRLLEGSTPYESVGIESEALQITAKAVSARFWVLLYPLKDENAIAPATSWDEATSTMRVGEDEIRLAATGEGATVVASMSVAGGDVAFQRNEVFRP